MKKQNYPPLPDPEEGPKALGFVLIALILMAGAYFLLHAIIHYMRP
jgi:hypothetical protein